MGWKTLPLRLNGYVITSSLFVGEPHRLAPLEYETILCLSMYWEKTVMNCTNSWSIHAVQSRRRSLVWPYLVLHPCCHIS
jgi:hypothetical protein